MSEANTISETRISKGGTEQDQVDCLSTITVRSIADVFEQ